MICFDGWTLDELHTVSTALGNAVVNMINKQKEIQQTEASDYIDICIEDAEKILAVAVMEINQKK